MANDQADYYSGITSITVNGKNAYELKGKFLDDLHNNAFSGTNGEDEVEHIKYFLKIVDPIDLPNVNLDKLRVVVFPISLVGDAWRWFDGIKGSITSWVDLTANFFEKYYPASRTGKVNTPIIKWDPTNPKFKNCDEIEPINDEASDLEETDHDDEQEIGDIFRIETNLFNYETPLCEKFKEFNYLLKIDPDVLTNDIEGFKTYDEYKDDWIYEWNENGPWVHEKPWTDTGVWTEPALVVPCCKPFNYKTRCSEWPTCSWREDGYCNGENLPGAYIVENMLHYQDLEWHKALKDSELKEEALRNKVILEGLINDNDESSNNGWRRWDGYEIADHDQEEREYEHEDEEKCELFNDHEFPVCTIRRFEVIKYSFGQDIEYVGIKEDEYEDLTNTSKEAIHAYQEIFRMMDEGWMLTRAE
ncbi:hypothetical protein Tco_1068466 [Tanacetum coccineum]|uniref:Retrotransposon gag domain-containing protein n=1 Tax=Tanacetum coccineum TaxID=301880 RepID=A0ABQ5HGN6_9ASTR